MRSINLFVGDSNHGHAELVENSLQACGIVRKLYRGRDCRETLKFVRRAQRGCKDATRVPSLVLLDWSLPHTGGVSVLTTLKSDCRYSWIPVIMMTTAYDRQQAEQCRRLGCDAYVTKWTVFLGLSGFVTKVRSLADNAVLGASRRLGASGFDDHGAHTLDILSIVGAATANCYGQERIENEMRDGSASP